MTVRKIIKIDEDKCNGCGECITGCPEGAIQIIDGKARLVSDLFCDGLGACIGTCPMGAIKIEERDCGEYDEKQVMENIIPKGKNTILAHLKHLKDHGEMKLLRQALGVLNEKGVPVPEDFFAKPQGHACPGSKIMQFDINEEAAAPVGGVPSALRQWPVQLHLVSPLAPYFQNKDVLLAADCVAFTVGDFHPKFLKGKSLAIACPKLDSNKESYVEKIRLLIDESRINTLTVMIMEVPCCGGLLMIAKEALEKSERKIPIKKIIVGLRGEIKEETWV